MTATHVVDERPSALAEESITIVVSDLHFGEARGADAAPAGEAAFASFLEWVRRRSGDDGRRWRIVILGDLLDLLHAPGETPVAAVEAAARSRPAFEALAAAAASGIGIAIVPGNHDSELLDPEVQERLRELVAEAGGHGAARIRHNLTFHAWFFLLPGLLYAEHGSQYHALNAVADPLSPAGRWSRQTPLGALLDLHRSELHGRAARLRRLRVAVRALVSVGRGSRPRFVGHGGRARRVRERAQESRLRPATLKALRSLARDSRLDLVRSAVAAVQGSGSHVEVQQKKAAAAVHRLLLGEGKSVPVYVFGHTHRAARASLHAGDTELHWFNSGAWVAPSEVAPDARGRASSLYSFVEIVASPAGVVAHVGRWNPAEGVAVPVDAEAVPVVQAPTARPVGGRRLYEAPE
jgi:UDP-2,3-diacylglucosamine pyrophosphatase LpxH